MLTPSHPQARTPPANVQAEQILLGCLLATNSALARVSDYLSAPHFADPLHGRIYEVCAFLIGHGRIANPVTLRDFFTDDADMAKQGGDKYLAAIVAAACPVISANDYGRLIYDLALRRGLVEIGEDVINAGFSPSFDVTASQIVEKAQAALLDLDNRPASGGLQRPKVYTAAAIASAESVMRNERPVGAVLTGIPEFDKKTGGLQPSDLIILGGRPSLGKSALAKTWAYNAAKSFLTDPSMAGRSICVFNLETTAEAYAKTMIAPLANVPASVQVSGPITDYEFRRMAEAAEIINGLPLLVDDSSHQTPQSILNRASRAKAALIIIDYLQLVQSTKPGPNRLAELTEITRALKAIAKQLHIPVLALAQVNRGVEARDDKRPLPSDIREAGSIEQDADVIAFVYREHYYLQNGEPRKREKEPDLEFQKRHSEWAKSVEDTEGLGEIIIAKQKLGPVGTCKVAFDGPMTTWYGRAVQEDMRL